MNKQISLNRLLKEGDDYAKIFILVWFKVRDLFLDPYDSSKSSIEKNISLKTRIKKTLKFIRSIKKQCSKINKFHNIINFLTFVENELISGKNFVEKLSQLSIIAQLFDLPQPINDLINILGLNNDESNKFSKEINDLFENIDDEDIKSNLHSMEKSIDEGTLANFIKNKENTNTSSQEPKKINLKFSNEESSIIEKKEIPKPIQKEQPAKPNNNIQILTYKDLNRRNNMNFYSRRQYTPNPRTSYRNY